MARRRKLIRSSRIYRSIAGKVMQEIEVVNDNDTPGVTLYFQDGTQFDLRVRPQVEFQACSQKMVGEDLIVMHTFQPLKEVKY